MRALQLVEHGKPGRFEIRTLAQLVPQPGEAVVTVAACGLNHLDLWLEEAGLPIPVVLPRTPGCEIAGAIARIGPGVAGWQVGDRVAVQSNLFCGECEFCRRGEESLCLKGELLGVQRDGGFAEEVVVPARSLVRIPEGVDYDAAAALGLAGSTAMHMLTDRGQVRAGDWVLVLGASSGVGSAAIQIAKGLGAKVISTGSTLEKRQLAKGLGADEVVDLAADNWPAEVRRITGKRGVDWVIEHIGGTILERVFECVARGGTVVTCGATAGRSVQLDLWPIFVKQQRLVGSYGRNRRDLVETLKWAAEGRLKPVIASVHALEEGTQALAALRDRKVLGKALIKP